MRDRYGIAKLMKSPSKSPAEKVASASMRLPPKRMQKVATPRATPSVSSHHALPGLVRMVCSSCSMRPMSRSSPEAMRRDSQFTSATRDSWVPLMGMNSARA